MPPDPLPPGLAQLRPILRDLRVAEPLALTELSGGSNAAYRIELADGSSLVLKTYDELRGKAPDGEAYATAMADAGTP